MRTGNRKSIAYFTVSVYDGARLIIRQMLQPPQPPSPSLKSRIGVCLQSLCCGLTSYFECDQIFTSYQIVPYEAYLLQNQNVLLSNTLGRQNIFTNAQYPEDMLTIHRQQERWQPLSTFNWWKDYLCCSAYPQLYEDEIVDQRHEEVVDDQKKTTIQKKAELNDEMRIETAGSQQGDASKSQSQSLIQLKPKLQKVNPKRVVEQTEKSIRKDDTADVSQLILKQDTGICHNSKLPNEPKTRHSPFTSKQIHSTIESTNPALSISSSGQEEGGNNQKQKQQTFSRVESQQSPRANILKLGNQASKDVLHAGGDSNSPQKTRIVLEKHRHSSIQLKPKSEANGLFQPESRPDDFQNIEFGQFDVTIQEPQEDVSKKRKRGRRKRGAKAFQRQRQEQQKGGNEQQLELIIYSDNQNCD